MKIKKNRVSQKTDNPKVKNNNKLKTFVLGYDSEKMFKKDLVLSVQLSRRKSHDVESSYKMENLLNKI